MLIFYVRHGDPIYDPDSLTPLGHRQAEAVAKRLALYGIDRIFASTSNRAIQTATPTSELVKKEIELLDFCNEGYAWREFSIPDGNGGFHWTFQDKEMCRLFASAEMRNLGSKWFEHPDVLKYNFEKGVKRVQSNLDEWLKTLGYAHDIEKGVYNAISPSDERVALFAHQGFGVLFLSSLLDIPYPQIATHFDMCHTGVTVIELAEKDGIAIPKVLTLSNDSHIFKDGLPTCYNNFLYF